MTVGVLVYPTLVVKHFEDGPDNGVIVVGTLVVHVIASKKEYTNELPIRVNNRAPEDGVFQLRNRRGTKFEPLLFGDDEGEDAKSIKEFIGFKQQGAPPAMCYTYNARIPLVLTQEPTLTFPFSVLRASVKLEFSSVYIPEEDEKENNNNNNDDRTSWVKLRPSIVDFSSSEHPARRAFVCIPEKIELKDLDESKEYDFANFFPSIEIPACGPKPQSQLQQQSETNNYFPIMKLEWIAMKESTRPVFFSYAPLAVVLALQWFNCIFTLVDGDPSGYFQNAIGLVLVLIVLIPSIREGRALKENVITSADYIMLIFFLGTIFSAIPVLGYALFGLIISSLSMFTPFPLTFRRSKFLDAERRKPRDKQTPQVDAEKLSNSVKVRCSELKFPSSE